MINKKGVSKLVEVAGIITIAIIMATVIMQMNSKNLKMNIDKPNSTCVSDTQSKEY